MLCYLTGIVNQIPPAYSAKNVGGTRSYVLARQGIEVELKPKQVEINSIEVETTSTKNAYKFTIKCKGGTYIRSICRDIAYALNTYATMTKLTREKSGCFDLSNSVSAEEINSFQDIEIRIIKPEDTVYFEVIELNNKKYSDLINGRFCEVNLQNGLYKIYYENVFIGVGEVENNNLKCKAYVNG